MIQEQVQATASQAHYSPEEAGEILRIAAHLQDNTITAEQLRAIAREAGVSDENLERAIQQYGLELRQGLPAATPCPIIASPTQGAGVNGNRERLGSHVRDDCSSRVVAGASEASPFHARGLQGCIERPPSLLASSVQSALHG
jgi:hypothetical protein